MMEPESKHNWQLDIASRKALFASIVRYFNTRTNCHGELPSPSLSGAVNMITANERAYCHWLEGLNKTPAQSVGVRKITLTV